MSKSKRRRRSKQRKKYKLRKLLRKIQQKRNRELLYSKLLNAYQDYINENYHRGEITLYRWVHNPYTDDDFLPQIFQSFSDRDISDVYRPLPTDTPKKVGNYVKWFTVSHYLTEEQAIENYKKTISNIQNGDYPERVDGFMENKGTYVVSCNYTEDDALYGKPGDDGHINVLLCNGFDPKRVVDTTYTPVKII